MTVLLHYVTVLALSLSFNLLRFGFVFNLRKYVYLNFLHISFYEYVSIIHIEVNVYLTIFAYGQILKAGTSIFARANLDIYEIFGKGYDFLKRKKLLL